jgi:hypothetical protein
VSGQLQRLREEYGSVIGAGAYDHDEELGALDDAFGNRVSDETLQPGYTVRRSGGGRRKRVRSKPKPQRNRGRPTIEDEPRSIRDSVRMTPEHAATAEKARAAGVNSSDVLAFALHYLATGDDSPLVELRAALPRRDVL